VKTAKFWVGLVSAVATSLLAVFAPSTTTYHVLSVIVALAGAIGVYLVPNAGPTAPAGVTGQYVGK
jgi:hypothetical protein